MTMQEVSNSTGIAMSENIGGGYLREPDRYLPIANISRIMKNALPPNAKVSKDAKEICKECASEFIGLITCEASEKCMREKRKTIMGEDILWALAALGFEDYLEPLNLFLLKYRAAVVPNEQVFPLADSEDKKIDFEDYLSEISHGSEKRDSLQLNQSAAVNFSERNATVSDIGKDGTLPTLDG